MKICFITNTRQCFDQLMYHKEARSLVEAGQHIVIIAPVLASDNESDTSRNYLRVKVVPLGHTPLFDRGEIGTRLERLLQLPRLFRLARGQAVDVYQAMELATLIIGVLLKLTTGRQLVYDSRENYPLAMALNSGVGPRATAFLYRCFLLFERLLVRWVDHIFVAHEADAGRLAGYGPETSVVLNVPLSESGSHPAPHVGIRAPANSFHLVCAGYTGRRIAVESVAEAVAILRDQGVSVRATFLGVLQDDPQQVKRWQSYIESRGIQDQVKLIGVVPHQRVIEELRGAQAGHLIYRETPYIRTVTNFVKMFEYFSLGLPVICSDLPNLRKLVEEPGYGLVVQPEDPESIARAIRLLKRDPERATRMGAAGRQAFLQRLNWEHVSKSYVGVYRQLSCLHEKRIGEEGTSIS